MMIRDDEIPQKYIPNLFNVNRELYTSNRFMILSINDIWIGSKNNDN